MTAPLASDGGRVVCVIPAYNVEGSLRGVVDGLRAALPGATIVGVDDGSSDGTRDIIRATCDVTGGFAENRGKGAALRAGFVEALALGASEIVSIDGDGQHDPAHAPALLGALARADLVVGARRRERGMPWRRRVTNTLSAVAIRRLTGRDVPDPQSGFRAMRAIVARRVDASGDRYEFETDFLIRAIRAGFPIAWVGIPTIYGPPSHFRGLRDGYRVVATFWRHAWPRGGE